MNLRAVATLVPLFVCACGGGSPPGGSGKPGNEDPEMCGDRIDGDGDGQDDFADPDCVLGMDALQGLQSVADDSLGAVGALLLGIEDAHGKVGLVASGFAAKGGRDLVPTDRMAIGSMTKTMVATVVLQLRDEGNLSLEDSLEKWLPDFPRAEQIELRHLLSHTSGVFDFTWDSTFSDRIASGASITVDEMVEVAASHAPLFDPGAGWSYSNSNYILLGRVIEMVTGHTAAVELRRRIFEPMGMHDTFLLGSEEVPGGLQVHGYVQGGLGWIDFTDQWNGTGAWTAGGIVSTTPDILRFSHGLVQGELLAPETFAEMTRNPSPMDEGSLQYGLGIILGAGWIGHDGAVPGWMAQWVHMEDGTTVVVMQNRLDDAAALSRAIVGTAELLGSQSSSTASP